MVLDDSCCFQTLSYGGRFKFKLMIEAINSRTPPPSDDIIANSLIYLIGNFRVKLFYPLPTQLNGGRSRGSRRRLDFDVIMREVSTMFSVVCLLRNSFVLTSSFTSLLCTDWKRCTDYFNLLMSNVKLHLQFWCWYWYLLNVICIFGNLTCLFFAVNHLMLHWSVCCI